MGYAALNAGVETHEIEGVEVRVFSGAKTVVDCFRHRKAIGLEIAIEALRAYLSGRHRNISAVRQLAARLRIGSVMQPYLAALSFLRADE